jgi:hypothetical protein
MRLIIVITCIFAVIYFLFNNRRYIFDIKNRKIVKRVMYTTFFSTALTLLLMYIIMLFN